MCTNKGGVCGSFFLGRIALHGLWGARGSLHIWCGCGVSVSGVKDVFSRGVQHTPGR